MKILIVGSGAREHALAETFKRSKRTCELYCYGAFINPGISSLTKDYASGELSDIQNIIKYAKSKQIDLAFIGPEAPLEKGLADALWEQQIQTIGPYKKLAQLETSKAFARNLMQKYKIPGLPRYKQFTELNSTTKDFLQSLGEDNYVIKADGLMGGKGVKLAGEHLHCFSEAYNFCQSLSSEKQTFVIEEKLRGQEFSLMCFFDGKTLVPMPLVQDHKRAYNSDTGPNTGGMGSYSDVNHSLPFLTIEEHQAALDINQAVLSALQTEFSQKYMGILYGSFIATKAGVFVIEFNARFGDPEALNVLAILETDFIDLCQALVSSNLDTQQISFASKATVCKYKVPEGYPDNPKSNFFIDVSKTLKDHLYFASVRQEKEKLLALGSRTVAYVGIADTIANAEQKAEREMASIEGPLFHRRDIGTAQALQKRIQEMLELRQESCELQS